MYLFVYGSLRKGLPNAHLLDTEEYLGIVSTRYHYSMVGLRSGSYPYLVTEPLHPSLVFCSITGELYRISQEKREELDRLEGESYQRIQTIVYDHQREYIADLYIATEDTMEQIAKSFEKRFICISSGDWKTHLSSV